MNRAQSVEQYISKSEHWQKEVKRLRDVLLATQLNEEIKWGAPCYTHKGKNVVGIGAFKAYFGLWFHQGALLSDDGQFLINAQAGKTKALRQWRMTSAREIKPTIIKRYVKESIAHIEAGRAIKADNTKPINVPTELRNALRRQKNATAAFRQLGKGAQREFAEYVEAAKRQETKNRRIEKILPMILRGSGLNDKYRR